MGGSLWRGGGIDGGGKKRCEWQARGKAGRVCGKRVESRVRSAVGGEMDRKQPSREKGHTVSSHKTKGEGARQTENRMAT